VRDAPTVTPVDSDGQFQCSPYAPREETDVHVRVTDDYFQFWPDFVMRSMTTTFQQPNWPTALASMGYQLSMAISYN
jgi:hypothetical protein